MLHPITVWSVETPVSRRTRAAELGSALAFHVRFRVLGQAL